jgi:hypothetical protein
MTSSPPNHSPDSFGEGAVRSPLHLNVVDDVSGGGSSPSFSQTETRHALELTSLDAPKAAGNKSVWTPLLFFSLFAVVAALALGLGLGVGLRKGPAPPPPVPTSTLSLRVQLSLATLSAPVGVGLRCDVAGLACVHFTSACAARPPLPP